MAITSLKFFAFLAVIYLLYCLVPRQKRWFVLLGASLFFYVVCGSLRLFVVTLLQILVAYGAAIRTDKQQREGVSTKINTAGILTCLAVLFQIGRFALLQRDELLCDQWQCPASSAGKGKYLVPLADSSTAGDFLLYIKLYRIHFGCLLGRCQPAEEFFEVLPFWHLLSDHDLWSDHAVSGDRTGFVCGKPS